MSVIDEFPFLKYSKLKNTKAKKLKLMTLFRPTAADYKAVHDDHAGES